MLNKILKHFENGNENIQKSISHLLKNYNFNPYHNTLHNLTVAYYVSLVKPNDDCLIVASLFHDFKHSGGKFKDDKNIEISIEEFSKFCDDELSFSKYEKAYIKELIEITMFPYSIKTKDLLNQDFILIREADASSLAVDYGVF